MDDFLKINAEVNSLSEDISSLESELIASRESEKNQIEDINSLVERVNAISQRCGVEDKLTHIENVTIDEINKIVEGRILSLNDLTDKDAALRMNEVDALVACLAGGIAVLLDFLVVKIPKDMKFSNDGKTYFQKGSSLTENFDKIGLDNEGNERKWIKALEKWFQVPYDKSIDVNIPHMYPKNHRVYSLAHEPSLTGLIWGIKDIVQGTFSYLDRNGILHIEKVAEAHYYKLLYAPIKWCGHLLSDVFTKMGLPVPANSLLRLMQFGSFGEKERTIAEISEFMYLNGYNMKHFATMSISNATIELILFLYQQWTESKPIESELLSEREYFKAKSAQKKNSLRLTAYSVATCGNIAKVAAYSGNPTAINLPIWYAFIKESILKVEVLLRDHAAEDAIEHRHVIESNFEELNKLLNAH